MWNPTKQERLDRISAELIPLSEIKDLSEAQYRRMKALVDEGENLVAEKATCKKAAGMMSMASPAEHGFSDINPGHFDGGHFGKWMPGTQLKTFGAPQAPVVAPTSPMQLDGYQLEALRQAAINKSLFSVTVG